MWDAPGRGAKARWREDDLQYLEQKLEQDQRTYTSTQLSQTLAQERGVTLSADQIRRILKKRGIDGSVPATRSSSSHKM